MGKSTADAATAKLFGAPARASKAPSPTGTVAADAAPAGAGPPLVAAEQAQASSAGAGRSVRAAAVPRSVPAKRDSAETPVAPPSRPRRGAATQSAASAPTRRAPEDVPNAGNYLGRSLYLYKGVEARKLSVYVEPSLAAGLRMAAASGADPRGSDMSEIVDTLLRENGYADWRPPGS